MLRKHRNEVGGTKAYWLCLLLGAYAGFHFMIGNGSDFERAHATSTPSGRQSNSPPPPGRQGGEPGAPPSSTGTAFGGGRIRTFAGERGAGPGIWGEPPPIIPPARRCSRWGVVTTINDPSEAVARVARLPSWCLVIVPDAATPGGYMSKLASLLGNVGNEMKNIHFFSKREQQRWQDAAGPLGDFVRLMPWNHFCRKNLGYLFAIAGGAAFIFDFDDDNYIALNNDGLPAELLPGGEDPSKVWLKNVSVVALGGIAFNHHPVMGAPEGSWARGFPISLVRDESAHGEVAFGADLSLAEVGVLQLLADGDPDVDAVHRMTRPLPMSFDAGGARRALVPVHAYSPYNAQATIHARDALWALLLPRTVPGRVSDIWRSYFAQCIFADAGPRVVFSRQGVVQHRNDHDYLADFRAERDLYERAGRLVEHLGEWDSDGDTVPRRMEDLWIDLYERGYVEIEDVLAVQAWLGALAQVGYEFPPLKRRRHRNVAVMGQFNFANRESTVQDVIFWAQKTREHFRTVVAAGPFSNSQMRSLEDNSITSRRGDYDLASGQNGFYSPLGNMRDALRSFENSSGIEGVIYVHDDGILNLTELSGGRYPFPSEKIIYNHADSEPSVDNITFRAFADGHTESPDKSSSFESLSKMVDEISTPWYHFNRDYCVRGQLRLAADPASEKYRESDGSILFAPPSQSDFAYVPVKYAGEFKYIAELFLRHGVFIECALPTALRMLLRRRPGAGARQVALCSNWTVASRGRRESLGHCLRDETAFGFVHPIKMSYGYRDFSEAYDEMQRAASPA